MEDLKDLIIGALFIIFVGLIYFEFKALFRKVIRNKFLLSLISFFVSVGIATLIFIFIYYIL